MGNNACTCGEKYTAPEIIEYPPTCGSGFEREMQESLELPKAAASDHAALAKDPRTHPDAAISAREKSALNDHQHQVAASGCNDVKQDSIETSPAAAVIASVVGEERAANLTQAIANVVGKVSGNDPNVKKHEEPIMSGQQNIDADGDSSQHDVEDSHGHARSSADETPASAQDKQVSFACEDDDARDEHKPRKCSQQVTLGGIVLLVIGAILGLITATWWCFGCSFYNIGRVVCFFCMGMCHCIRSGCESMARVISQRCKSCACCFKSGTGDGVKDSGQTCKSRCDLIGKFIFSEGWARKPNWHALRIEKKSHTLGAFVLLLVEAILHLLTALWWCIGCVLYNIGRCLYHLCINIVRCLKACHGRFFGKEGRVTKFMRNVFISCSTCCHACWYSECRCCKSWCDMVGRFFFSHGWTARFPEDRLKELCDRELAKLRMQY